MNNYPIILAHGIARFDFLLASFIKQLGPLAPYIEVATDGIHYFKGIARHLRKNGFDVYHSSVSFAAGLPQRAEDLKTEVNRILDIKGGGRIHIIGHSMGGLDSRYMIAHLGMGDRVASLTTIGTPHLGTSLADWGCTQQNSLLVKNLAPVIDLQGFLALTTEACGQFNESALDAEVANEVFYQTYASAQPQKQIFTPLKPTWELIMREEGNNDGLVSYKSQRWLSELAASNGQKKQIKQIDFPVPADHLNEIGWWDLSELDLNHTPLLQVAQSVIDYESSIKNIYLQIALDVAAL